jgi:hypothetical protein
MTLKEIGNEFGLSSTRVGQIIFQALKRLRFVGRCLEDSEFSASEWCDMQESAGKNRVVVRIPRGLVEFRIPTK